MKRKIPLYQTILIALAAAFLAGIISVQVTGHIVTERDQAVMDAEYERLSGAERLAAIRDLLREHYMGEFEEQELLDAACKQYVNAVGDKYGRFYTAEEYAALLEEENGNGVGIGAIVEATEEGIVVLIVAEDSPAALAGVLPGDLIVGTDSGSYETLGYTGLSETIRGEAGTAVTLRILREGSERTVTVTRSGYTVPTVVSSMAQDGKTGIIRVRSFENITPEQFDKALENLLAQGATGLVFDLRDNPGGLLTAVTKMLDTLLPEGLITTIRLANGEKKEYRSDEEEIGLPMAVVVNGNTASAAELFTAALRDYGKATVVGENTFGKGIVQTSYSLADGSAVKMTTAYYDPPSGENFHGVGVAPDLPVKQPAEVSAINPLLLSEAEDAQLAAAIAALRT